MYVCVCVCAVSSCGKVGRGGQRGSDDIEVPFIGNSVVFFCWFFLFFYVSPVWACNLRGIGRTGSSSGASAVSFMGHLCPAVWLNSSRAEMTLEEIAKEFVDQLRRHKYDI